MTISIKIIQNVKILYWSQKEIRSPYYETISQIYVMDLYKHEVIFHNYDTDSHYNVKLSQNCEFAIHNYKLPHNNCEIL